MRRLLCCYVFAVLFSSNCSLFAQEKVNNKDFFVEAESYFLFDEYKEALPLYQRILRTEPDNYNVIFKVGICYLNDPYQKEKSTEYLLKASKNINWNYKVNSYKEKQAPPETYYYLAQAYRINGQVDKAQEYYILFKKSVEPDDFDFAVVDNEIKSSENSKLYKKSPVYLTRKRIENKINSRFAESNAILSGDGKTLIFNRELQFYDAVFITYKDENGNWGAPYNLTPDFALDGNSYCTGISFNGDEIYVYRSDNFDGNIYSSVKVDGKWQPLVKLNALINTKYWESHASPSPDGKYLYFTSNRRGGYGGLDIYKAMRVAGNKWGEPVNLGPVVNSPYNEDAPFVSPKDQNLYFSSLGHNSMGGYDIFVSRQIGPGKWARPVNMGYPLNTTDDDVFFCPASSGSGTGIQCFYEPSSTAGLKDIYWIEVYNAVLPRLFTVNGQVNVPDTELLQEEGVTVSLIDNKAAKIVQEVKADDSGRFEIKAKQGTYLLRIDGKGIKPVTVPLELALTQNNSKVEIPEINAVAVAKEEVKEPLVLTEPPRLELETEEYIITDSVPIKIDFVVEKGSSLSVKAYVNNGLNVEEEYLMTKEKFSYIYTPEPGENRIAFTLSSENGRSSDKEVNIYYEPIPEVVDEVASEQKTETTEMDEVAYLANEALANYLKSLDTKDINSLTELYDLLIAGAADHNYTENDVESLFRVLLTQREKEEFIGQIKDIKSLEALHSNDSLIGAATIPLALIKQGKSGELTDVEMINTGLIQAVPHSGDNLSLASYILTFSDKPEKLTASFNAKNSDEIRGSLFTQLDEADATKAVELSSSTEGLQQFYNNLLLSSDGELLAVLKGVNFDSLHIRNSIELVEYLFDEMERLGISKSDLISAIEKARAERQKNILQLKEALSDAATGELKRHIQEIDIESGKISELEELISLLLRDSKTHGYTRAEVYNVLLDMLEAGNVNDFIDELIKHAEGSLKEVLLSMERSQFSLPVEVIQYLLAQAPYFDYTESDVNNLLIKILLEKGLDNWKLSQKKLVGEVEESRRFIATLILVNLFAIILLILLIRRRKEKKEQNRM